MAKKKILLVDDEGDFLELMGERIKEWGYGLITASNGKDAIDTVKSKKPEIVILDFMLPDMDGVSILREIRAINTEIPVIMFTAYPDTKVMQEAEKLGISTFIPKVSIYSDAHASLKSAIELIERNKDKAK